jgi:hypothetical protein
MGNTATADAAPQHMRALERANHVRLARAELKRKVADESLAAADVVMNCPWQADRMAISELLMSQRRWGRTRARRLLTSLGISENKLIGTLTARQRTAVAAVLTKTPTANGAAPESVPPGAARSNGQRPNGRRQRSEAVSRA